MRKAIARGGVWFVLSATVEVILAALGLVRFSGNQFIDTDDYLVAPMWAVWLYCTLPVLAGLFIFFINWSESLDAEEKEKKRQQRLAESRNDES